jgi:hypothetical protein
MLPFFFSPASFVSMMLEFCAECQALLVFDNKYKQLVCVQASCHRLQSPGDAEEGGPTDDGAQPILLAVHTYPTNSDSETDTCHVPNAHAVVHDSTLLQVTSMCHSATCLLRDSTNWGKVSPVSGLHVAPFASQTCIDKVRGKFMSVCHACLGVRVNDK